MATGAHGAEKEASVAGLSTEVHNVAADAKCDDREPAEGDALCKLYLKYLLLFC